MWRNELALLCVLLAGVSCQAASDLTGATKVSGADTANPSVVDRGAGDLLSFVQTINTNFNVDPTTYNVGLISGASVDCNTAPLYVSSWKPSLVMTKWINGYVEDPTTFSSQNINQITIPFETNNVSIKVNPVNEVRLSYFVIDSQLALDKFNAMHLVSGYLTDANTSTRVVLNNPLSSLNNLTFEQGYIKLICLMENRVLSVSRTNDPYTSDFLAEQASDSRGLTNSFATKYGDGTCRSLIEGAYIYDVATFSISQSPNTFAELRQAILQFGKSYFNVSGVAVLSKETQTIIDSTSWVRFGQGYSVVNPSHSLNLGENSTVPATLMSFISEMQVSGHVNLISREYDLYK